MRIIVEFQSFPGTEMTASGNFLIEMLVEMAQRHEKHSFVFLDSKIVKKIGRLPDNASIHKLNNNFSKWLGKRFWYRFYLPKELKKLKTDLFVTVDNFHLRRINFPSCLLSVHGNELFQQETPRKISGKTARMFTRAINTATTILTFSDYHRQKIKTIASATRIAVVLPQPDDIPELKWPEKEVSKIDFAAGVEYFAFVGDLNNPDNLVELLKAFALFKKWQQSNMQLVIAGNKTLRTIEFSEKLSSFKYRNEVNLLINPSKDKVHRIVGGAYAFVHAAANDSFPVHMLLAMRLGIPVISAADPVTSEWCGDTVMYAETTDAEGFAKCMQLMYKDERQRSDLILAAKNQLLSNKKNDMVESCLDFFEETIAK